MCFYFNKGPSGLDFSKFTSYLLLSLVTKDRFGGFGLVRFELQRMIV
jgi:hypothetical protein